MAADFVLCKRDPNQRKVRVKHEFTLSLDLYTEVMPEGATDG